MAMHKYSDGTFILYIDENGEVQKQWFENIDECNSHVVFSEGYYYYCEDPGDEDDTERGTLYFLHEPEDSADASLVESEGNRIHHHFFGLLHNIHGPAFTCEKSDGSGLSKEYYLFGLWLDTQVLDGQGFLEKHREYLSALQSYLEDFDWSPEQDAYGIEECWSLESVDNLIKSAEGGYFVWRDGEREQLVEPEEDVVDAEFVVDKSSGMAAMMGALALGVVTTMAVKKAKEKKVQQEKKEEVRIVG